MSFISTLRARLTRTRDRDRPEAAALRAGELIDAEWYAMTYPEVARSGRSPVDDYLEVGASAGRNPNPFFDTAWYLKRYPDVASAGLNPLVHYVEDGAAEGRDPGPDFDTSFYAKTNPEAAAAGLNPLAHYLGRGRAEGRLPRQDEHDVLSDYEAALLRRRSLVGAAEMDHVHFPLRPRMPDFDAQGRPLPPLTLAQRIGAPNFGEYEWIGKGTRETILRCLPPDFSFEGARVLDFGCGVGRVMRQFSTEAQAAEFWGCDIDGPSIRWAVENMSPPFRLFQLSEIPTLPLESNSFDLIYAISVFAHIHADWHHWMAEVRRIMKPGGYAFVTFMSQTPYEEMLHQSYWDQGPHFGKYVKNPFADWNDGGPMAFHNPDWIKTYWGNLFDIEFIALEGLLEYQSICFMRKPSFGAPVKTDVPVVKYSTAQRFDPDAIGWIREKLDTSRGFRESFGVEARGVADIEGWIVFRAENPRSIDVTVDGERLDATVEFERATVGYRDWADTVQHAFAVRLDTSVLAPGEHRMTLVVHAESGRTHSLTIPLVVLDHHGL